MQKSTLFIIFGLFLLVILGTLGYQVLSHQSTDAQGRQILSELSLLNDRSKNVNQRVDALSDSVQQQQAALSRLQGGSVRTEGTVPVEATSVAPTPGKKIIYTESRFSLEVPTYCPVIAQKETSRVKVGSRANLDWASFTILSKAEYDQQVAEYAGTPGAPNESPQLKDKSYLVKTDPQDFLSELQPLTSLHPQAQIDCVPSAIIAR